MIKQLGKFVFAAGVLLASGAATATQCGGIGGAVTSYAACLNQACRDNILGSHPECFGASSNTAAGAKNVQATSLEQMLAISSGVSKRAATLTAPPGVVADSGNQTGLAAGSGGGKWNVWASVAESDNRYDRGTYFFNGADRTNKFDNRIDNFVLGGDYQFAPNLVFGLSAAFDSGRGSASSYTIAGGVDAAKPVTTSGYGYAPYLGWQINKDWALDATVGWGNGKNTVANSIKTDSRRFFYGANLGYSSWKGNWQFTGKGSYLFGDEKNGDSKDNVAGTLAGTSVTNKIGQFRLAGQAAYWMNGVMPYLGLGYVADNRSSTATAAQQDATAMGKNAWVWSFGANFISIKNAVTGGIGYEQETGRSRSKNDKLMANINVRF